MNYSLLDIHKYNLIDEWYLLMGRSADSFARLNI